MENINTIFTEGSKGGLLSAQYLINSGPHTRRTKAHFGNHRACSTHTLSVDSQLLKPPSQEKHRTWSPYPILNA